MTVDSLPRVTSTSLWIRGAELETLVNKPGVVMKSLDLTHVDTKVALLEAAGKLLCMPSYFEPNWDSFEECLACLDYAPNRIVLAFTNAEKLVLLGTVASTFFEILFDVDSEWISNGDNRSISVVLVSETSEIPAGLMELFGPKVLVTEWHAN